MNLFQKMNFISHSGKKLDFKIECDALVDKDWDTIAYLISKKIKFRCVTGIATGGTKLESALEKYITKDQGVLLIVDDVITTGKTMKECKDVNSEWKHGISGVVLFARGKCPDWITPVFQLNL